MRRESYQQYAIVAADSAQELTEQLNARLYELRDRSPKVTFEGMIARISYTEEVEVIEDLQDEYNKVGIKLTCQDCPYYNPILKADGTADKRSKWGDCEFAYMGRTMRDGHACDRLYQMINSGEVKLCLAEE